MQHDADDDDLEQNRFNASDMKMLKVIGESRKKKITTNCYVYNFIVLNTKRTTT